MSDYLIFSPQNNFTWCDPFVHNSLLVSEIIVESIGNKAWAASFPFLLTNLLFNSFMIFSNGSVSRILLALENVDVLTLIPSIFRRALKSLMLTILLSSAKPIQQDTKEMYLMQDSRFWGVAWEALSLVLGKLSAWLIHNY